MTGSVLQPEADTVVENTVGGLDKYLAETGNHLSAAEADLQRHLVSALPGCGPLPAGWRHGDFRECNLLWADRRCALIDFERSEPGPLVADFGKLATSLWMDHPELRTALFEGYGPASVQVRGRGADSVRSSWRPPTALAYGPLRGDPLVAAHGRRTVEPLLQEGRLCATRLTC
ncbi:phosphotransferase [Streptomyces sp. NPDC002853]